MTQPKLFFTGPKGAGVSTALTAISGPALTRTDVFVNEMTDSATAMILSLENSIMNVEGREKIHLCGIPSPERLDLDWDNMVAGATGLILLLDNTRPDPFKDMWSYLESFKNLIAKTEVAIGITKMDINKKPTIADYHYQMQVTGMKPPIFTTDARDKNDVFLLVQAVLYSLDPTQV